MNVNGGLSSGLVYLMLYEYYGVALSRMLYDIMKAG